MLFLNESASASASASASSVEYAFFAQKTLAEGFESHECGAHACRALRWLLHRFLRRPAPQSGPPCRPSPLRPRAFAPHAQWPRAMKRCSVLRCQVSRNLNPFAGQLLRRVGPSIAESAPQIGYCAPLLPRMSMARPWLGAANCLVHWPFFLVPCRRPNRPHLATGHPRPPFKQGSCNHVAERISMHSANCPALKVRAARYPRPAPESLASRARRPAHSQLHSRRRAIEHAPALRARCPMTALDRPCTRPPIQCPPRPPRALRTW